MENYIVINGRKAELTEEQLIALGINVKREDPFELKYGDYYLINIDGKVESDYYYETHTYAEDRHNVANFCTDKNIMEQRALHETLNRLLWRYSMQHDGDKIDWSDIAEHKYKIYYNNYDKLWTIDSNQYSISVGDIYFFTRDIAEAAIEKVIKPFMREHPDFKW